MRPVPAAAAPRVPPPGGAADLIEGVAEVDGRTVTMLCVAALTRVPGAEA